jgi:hypothetical protein
LTVKCPKCPKELKNEQALKFHDDYKHGSKSGLFGSTGKPAMKMFQPKNTGDHNIRDSKRGYLLCVKCGNHFQTYDEFVNVKCESLSQNADKTLREIEKEKKKYSSETAWLATQSAYVRGDLNWHNTVPAEERERTGLGKD